MKRKALLGTESGKLTCTSEDVPSSGGHRYVLALCACGNPRPVKVAVSNWGKQKSCGNCEKRTDDYFRWKGQVLKSHDGEPKSHLLVWDWYPWLNSRNGWFCICSCGKVTFLSTRLLNSGRVRSCGQCIPHRGSSDKYCVWWNMMQRCFNPSHPQYHNYGGRGVTVYTPWHNFKVFDVEVQARPSGKTWERIENGKGNYWPGNCEWKDMKEQNRNRRNNVYIEFRGQKMVLTDFASLLGLKRGEVARLLKGNTHRPALTPEQIWEIADVRSAWNELQAEKLARLSTSHMTAMVQVYNTEAHSMHPG